MTLHYAYGLAFDSELPLPELPTDPLTAPECVTIRIGRVPQVLPKRAGVLAQVSAHEAVIEAPNIARYHISRGEAIVIEPQSVDDPDSIRLFLLNAVLGVLFHQQRWLPLRASSVATPAGAVVIAGQSGIGKSTLAAVLAARGWGLLADDITLVKLDNSGVLVVIPGYPQIGLWADTLNYLGLPTGRRLRPSLEKYAIAPARFHPEPIPLRAVYTLSVINRDELILTPIEGARALPHLLRYVYGTNLGRALGAMTAHWETAGAIAEMTRVTQVTRPTQPGRLDALVALIKEDVV